LNAVVLLSPVALLITLRPTPPSSAAAITSIIALARANACIRGGFTDAALFTIGFTTVFNNV
jgi:hypothetical protein